MQKSVPADPTVRLLISLSTIISLTSAAVAQLAPPTGPIDHTGTTEIFQIPYSIDAPGSYRLARSVKVPGATNGISISTDNVTLDLDGHTLDGLGIGLDAIELQGGLERITIRNGIITDWGAGGVFDQSTPCTDIVVEDLTITDVEYTCVDLYQSGVTVRNVVARDGLAGIGVGPASRVIDCRVLDTGTATAISAGFGSVITGCITRDSRGFGIQTGDDCIIENSSSIRNNSIGVLTGTNALIRGCTVALNGAIGQATQAPVGPPVNPRTGQPIIEFPQPAPDDARRRNNEQSNDRHTNTRGSGIGVDGIRVGPRSLVTECIVRSNADDGIFAGLQSTINLCVVTANIGIGIRCVGQNVVTNCHVSNNLVAGISLDGDDCRIDGNTLGTNGGGLGILLAEGYAKVVRNDLSLDEIVVNTAEPVFAPVNDFTSPWTNFED